MIDLQEPGSSPVTLVQSFSYAFSGPVWGRAPRFTHVVISRSAEIFAASLSNVSTLMIYKLSLRGVLPLLQVSPPPPFPSQYLRIRGKPHRSDGDAKTRSLSGYGQVLVAPSRPGALTRLSLCQSLVVGGSPKRPLYHGRGGTVRSATAPASAPASAPAPAHVHPP